MFCYFLKHILIIKNILKLSARYKTLMMGEINYVLNLRTNNDNIHKSELTFRIKAKFQKLEFWHPLMPLLFKLGEICWKGISLKLKLNLNVTINFKSRGKRSFDQDLIKINCLIRSLIHIIHNKGSTSFKNLNAKFDNIVYNEST